MHRRSYLRLGLTPLVAVLAGCGGHDEGRATTTATLEPSELTTTGGDDVEVLVAEVVIRERDDGPRVYYRLRNDGDEDATVQIRTVLGVEGSGTYDASVYVDVPAGQEMFVEYSLVRWAELSAAEEEAVRRGDATLSVFVNGQERPRV